MSPYIASSMQRLSAHIFGCMLCQLSLPPLTFALLLIAGDLSFSRKSTVLCHSLLCVFAFVCLFVELKIVRFAVAGARRQPAPITCCGDKIRDGKEPCTQALHAAEIKCVYVCACVCMCMCDVASQCLPGM